MIKIKNGFSQVFISNVIPKTNTKVGYGCLWGVAVEILKKNSKMKNLFENDLRYECVTFHEFGRHIFTWSWISIYASSSSLCPLITYKETGVGQGSHPNEQIVLILYLSWRPLILYNVVQNNIDFKTEHLCLYIFIDFCIGAIYPLSSRLSDEDCCFLTQSRNDAEGFGYYYSFSLQCY